MATARADIPEPSKVVNTPCIPVCKYSVAKLIYVAQLLHLDFI